MKKISDNDFEKLKKLRSETNSFVTRISELTMESLMLRKELEEAENKFFECLKKQESYLQELYQKYGEGSLDIETGEIKTS